MPRRNRALIDALIDLPWWVGIGAALIGFVVFSALAGIRGAPITADNVVGSVATLMLSTLAGLLRWLVPLFCVLVSALSAFKRMKRAELIDATRSGRRSVRELSWQAFESLLAESYRQRGYSVRETGGYGSDGGVDLVLEKGGNTTFVQCKHWRARSVGVTVVRELLGVMVAQRAAAGVIGTSGSFTDDAVAFAADQPIELIDGKRLQQLLDRGQPPERASSSGERSTPRASPAAAARPPACPICARTMTERIARKGPRPGEAFWGCTAYPKCRGVRRM